ncbi:Na+:solute symporter [candidate division KSB1 bacterium]|nr:Na+:solute symporter [candidate division KSB1 bacterium]
MSLSSLDWSIIIVYNVLSLVVGLLMTKRAHQSTEEYFLAGRALPWWIAGTTMVATSFSCDTPLYVTKLVRTAGIYENWQWWCFGIGSLFATFFLAPLWRRAKVLTDVELTTLRYGAGKASQTLRVFRALWLALPINVIAMGWVILAMYKIMHQAVGLEKIDAIVIFTGLAYFYTLLSGQWGVALTDLVQYVIMQGGAIIFAWYAVEEVGGLAALKTGIESTMLKPDVLAMAPQPGPGDFFSASFWQPAFVGFVTYIGVTWWANVNSDGGGKVIQKQNSCKNEQHALLATLWYSFTNVAGRSWPWILTALASLLIYPTIADPEMAYPKLMMEILPSGLKGLLVASLLAAFMSTISTQLNWGASYLVSDVYKVHLAPGRTDKHYIFSSKVATTIVLIAAGLAAYFTESVTDAFKFVIAFGAGTGPVYILRWFWWRVNAWTEISAMIASSVITLGLPLIYTSGYGAKLLIITFGSAAIWITVTLLTKPVPLETLAEFYRRTAPVGLWTNVRRWGREHGRIVPAAAPVAKPLRGFAWGMLCVFGLTLGGGYALLLDPTPAVIYFILAAIGSFGLLKEGYLRTT